MAAAPRSRPRCRGRSGLRRATVLANGQSGRLEGKCHREQTADGPHLRAQARVKRCGKSAPGAGATRLARQTPPGARPSRGHGGPPPRQGQSPGRPLRWMATYGPPGPGQNPAYRPTHRHRRRRLSLSLRLLRPGTMAATCRRASSGLGRTTGTRVSPTLRAGRRIWVIAAELYPSETGPTGPGWQTGAGAPDQPIRSGETPRPPQPTRSAPGRSARPRA